MLGDGNIEMKEMRSPPQGAYSLGWHMYGLLTLRSWIRWWKAIEMRRNLNGTWMMTMTSGGNGIPGRGTSVKGKDKEDKVKRNEHGWCFRGTHPWEDVGGAKVRVVERDGGAGRTWGRTLLEPLLLECLWAFTRDAFIHEALSQLYSPLSTTSSCIRHCNYYYLCLGLISQQDYKLLQGRDDVFNHL